MPSLAALDVAADKDSYFAEQLSAVATVYWTTANAHLQSDLTMGSMTSADNM
jgi:hypothetical protein